MSIEILNVYAPFRGPTGYDDLVRNFLFALDAAGVDMSLHEFQKWSPHTIELMPEQEELFEDLAARRGRAEIGLCFCLPEQVPFNLSPLVVNYTMFETDRIPQNWVDASNRVDLTIVPNEFCKSTWIHSGVDPDRIKVVSPGIDTDVYRPDVSPMDLRDKNGRSIVESYDKRFIAVQEVIDRKNTFGLLESWFRAFDGDDNVCLLLKLSSYTFDRLAFFGQRVEELKKGVGKSSYAPIYIYTKLFSEKEMLHFLAAGTHYFSMSFGEGWDMTAIKMAAMGASLVVPYHTGYMEYLDNTTASLIPIDKKLPSLQQGITHRLYQGANWFAPDLMMAVSTLKNILQYPKEDKKRTRKLYTRILQFYSSDCAARRLLQVIDSFFHKDVHRRKVSSFAVSTKDKKPLIALICPTAKEDMEGVKCGIARYTGQLYEGFREDSFPFEPLIVGGDTRKYISWLSDHHIRLAHFQHEYQFYHTPGMRQILRCLKHKGIASVITQHTVARTPVKYNQALVENADHIVLHSKKASEILKEFKNRKADISIIPMPTLPLFTKEEGIDTPKFPKCFKDAFVISFFGFTYFHKGIHKLLSVFNLLRREKLLPRDFRLLLLSFRPQQDIPNYHNRCLRLMHRLKLDEDPNVVWIEDFLEEPELLSMLKKSKLIVLPYSDYGSIGASAAVRTCLRVSVPIVVTDTPFFSDIPEGVVNKVPDTIDDLADALIGWHINYQQYAPMQKERAKTFVKSNLMEKITPLYVKLYSQLIGT